MYKSAYVIPYMFLPIFFWIVFLVGACTVGLSITTITLCLSVICAVFIRLYWVENSSGSAVHPQSVDTPAGNPPAVDEE